MTRPSVPNPWKGMITEFVEDRRAWHRPSVLDPWKGMVTEFVEDYRE